MSAFQFTLQAVLIFLAIYLLNRFFSKTEPHEHTPENGLIKPSKVLSILCVAVSFLMLSGGLWLSFSNEDQITGIICSGMGLFGTIVILPSLSHFHNVSWDNSGITGPTGRSFPKFPTRQIHINWEHITKTGEAWSNLQLVEDENGRRIYWGYWYAGEKRLRERIYTQLNS